ncbi:hypothetical protein [Caballeronia sp. HLA56]
MTRFARTAGRRFGQVSSSIANVSRQFVPPNLNSWKFALYLIVFLMPGGSFIVLAMGWFENRQRRKTEKPARASNRTLLPAPCACPSSGGAGGA